jgi:hypothetical protein
MNIYIASKNCGTADVYMNVFIYTYIHIHRYICMYVYMYIHTLYVHICV